ncbi:MAG: hypothetical protein HC904_14775 [Blastochloris sp.]|nr:hypothetical protein [Blastochloris sp.]
MSVGLDQLSERKARLVQRCEAERAVVVTTCEDLRDSMSWVDMGMAAASMIAPKAKLFLPVLALALGSGRLGSLGRAGSLVSKVVAGWQFFNKAKHLVQGSGLLGLFGAARGRS